MGGPPLGCRIGGAGGGPGVDGVVGVAPVGWSYLRANVGRPCVSRLSDIVAQRWLFRLLVPHSADLLQPEGNF